MPAGIGYYGMGSWGLPEFGLTEKLFGGNKKSLTDAQQLNYSTQGDLPASTFSTGSDVLGARDESPTPQEINWDIVPNSDITAGQETTYTPTTTQSSSGSGSSGYSISGLMDQYGISRDLASQYGQQYGSDAGAQIDSIRGNINDMYGGIVDYYNSQLSGIPNEKAEDIAFLQQAQANQLGQLQSAKSQANAGLDTSRQGVVTRRADSIRELGSNLRNLIDTTRGQLGAMGAADSSAAQIAAPYAFAKLGSQGRADITRQANEQFSQIDLQRNQVEQEYNRQRLGVEQWLGDKMNSLNQYYRDLQSRIQEQKVNADAQRLQALNQLEEGLLNQALAQRNFFMQQAANFENSVKEWALNQINDIGAASQILAGQGNYQVQDINNPQMNGIAFAGGDPYGGIPQILVGGRRKDEENLA